VASDQPGQAQAGQGDDLTVANKAAAVAAGIMLVSWPARTWPNQEGAGRKGSPGHSPTPIKNSA